VSESNPLAGLTGDQADEAIDRFQAKVDKNAEDLRVQKDHLKAMKTARKNLEEPVPTGEQSGDTVTAQAEPAQITVEGGDV
jgi:hypothetical protein